MTHRYVELLADLGLADACQAQPALIGGINVMNGHVTQPRQSPMHTELKFSPNCNFNAT